LAGCGGVYILFSALLFLYFSLNRIINFFNCRPPNAGALWHIFKREDVPALTSFLKAFTKEAKNSTQRGRPGKGKKSKKMRLKLKDWPAAEVFIFYFPHYFFFFFFFFPFCTLTFVVLTSFPKGFLYQTARTFRGPHARTSLQRVRET
jgi:hypothetical protein